MSQSARMGYPPVLLSLGLEPDPRPKVTYTPPRVRPTSVEEAIRHAQDKPRAKGPQYIRWNGLIYRQDPNGNGEDMQFFSDTWERSLSPWSRAFKYGTPCPAPQEA